MFSFLSSQFSKPSSTIRRHFCQLLTHKLTKSLDQRAHSSSTQRRGNSSLTASSFVRWALFWLYGVVPHIAITFSHASIEEAQIRSLWLITQFSIPIHELLQNPVGLAQVVCQQVEERKSMSIAKSDDGNSLKFAMFAHVRFLVFFLVFHSPHDNVAIWIWRRNKNYSSIIFSMINRVLNNVENYAILCLKKNVLKISACVYFILLKK